MASQIKLAAALAAASLGLAACSGSGGQPASVTQDNLNTDVISFAVGTANIYGTSSGLNFAAAYRQPANGLHAGDSAVLVSTPSITLPFTLTGTAGNKYTSDPLSTAATGPAPAEVGTTTMTGTAQLASNISTFGQFGGVFQIGIEPFNYGEGGHPDSVQPFPVPLYDAVTNAYAACVDAGTPAADCPAPDPNQAPAWGGPPAFDLLGNGESPIGDGNLGTGADGSTYAGISEGLDVFQGLTPTVGSYTLGVSIASNVARSNYAKTASLTSAALLPTIAPATATSDASGNGGTYTQTFPAGVTEAYVQVIDYGPAALPSTDPTSDQTPVGCNGATAATPYYYTVEVTPASPTGTLGDAEGPSGNTTICTAAQNETATSAAATSSGSTNPPTGDVTADVVTVQSYGFDYPMYENTKKTSSEAMPPAAALAGANGQADVTISLDGVYEGFALQGASGTARLRAMRSAAAAKRMMMGRRSF